MEDWRYDSLNNRMDRLQEELREVKGRTHKVERWQWLFPMNVMVAISWLFAAGVLVLVIARAAAGS